MMNALGIFRMDRLVLEDLAIYTRQPLELEEDLSGMV